MRSFHVHISPKDLLKFAAHFADEVGTTLLYSGGDFDSAKKSFLFLFPYDTVSLVAGENAWDSLKEKIKNGFWSGFLSYEMGAYSDLEKTISHQKSHLPDAFFQKCAFRLEFEHSTDEAKVSYVEEFLPERWKQKLITKDQLTHFIQELPSLPCYYPPEKIKVIQPFSSKASYTHKVAQAKELIYDGEIYQVNLSHGLEIEIEELNPFLLFCHLAKVNPAPFSAFFKHKDFTIVSSSPERFLKKENGILETRPIKGTAPRGRSEKEDEINLKNLLLSPKENAELLMITDLMRNDLGKVSLAGSIETLKMHHWERYTNVYHLLSIIRSKAKPDLNAIDILRSCFPGGSISGCPKLRAMETIYDLEKRPRGVYTGSIGYVTQDGDFDFNIAIRTLVIQKNRVSIQLGGGIVADSDPLKEYHETLHKGASILKAISNKDLTTLN